MGVAEGSQVVVTVVSTGGYGSSDYKWVWQY